jgi:F420-dependent oxidoreductase-like protein
MCEAYTMDLCIFTEPQQGASYETLLSVAKATENLGFDAFFRSDHYLKIGDGDGLPGSTDAWITLAGLARETKRIRLGTLVSPVTFRLPGVLAIQVAQVDAMSGGRVELGLGTGWFGVEHAAYGIPFPENRFDLLEEQLEIITGLWSTELGATYDFTGKHYQVVDSPALPKPVQQPHPPIIIGGAGPKRTPRLAARYADEFNTSPSQTVDKVATLYAQVRAACAAIGRAPESLKYSTSQVVCCGRNEAEYLRRAEAIGSDPAELRKQGLTGTPGEVVEKIEAFRAIGVERFYLQVLDLSDLDHLELIASEVMRQL